MRTLWFEFSLTLRRLFRRPAQNGLLLATFSISVTLSVLTWSLFRTVYLSTPDFDPKGEYVRRWIPELAGVSDRFIHRPWEAPAGELRAAGVKLGSTYPSPLIHHEEARKRALAAYASLRRL